MNTTNGKIAEQSKRKIADALLAVNYRLFTDKEAVLSYLFENLYVECFAQKNPNTRNGIGILSNAILQHLPAYSIGGMHSMLLKWVENDMVIPSYLLIEQLKNGFQSISSL